MQIKYINGDATRPISSGNKIIVHCCNNLGLWGAGFVLALSKRWPHCHQQYLEMFSDGRSPILGTTQFVLVESDIVVANIIGQNGVRTPKNPRPVDYNAIKEGFRFVRKFAIENQASIHMPRIGCGLAGGDWSIIESLIVDELTSIDVTVYDWP